MILGEPVALALLRGTQVAALLVLFGTLGSCAFVLPRPADAAVLRRLRRLAIAGAAAALALGAMWFLAVAAAVGGASGPIALIRVLPSVLAYLGFARLLAVRLGLVVLLLAGLGATPAAGLGGPRLAGLVAISGTALGLQPWLGHAGAAGGLGGEVLPWAELAHLLGAGRWLGGLPALALALPALADPVPTVHRFATLALAAVLAIAASGALQAWFLVGGPGRLASTAYGRIVLLKTVLFAAALVLALVNRLVLSPRLGLPGTRRLLGLSIATEAAVGLGIVLAAGVLASLPPGADRAGAAPPWPLLALPAGIALLGAVVIALRLSRRIPPRSPLSGVVSP